MTTAAVTPVEELILSTARVRDITAASQFGIKTLAKKIGCTPSQLKTAIEEGATGELALKIVEFEDTLPKEHVLGANGTPVAAGEEGIPTTRDRKPAKRAARAASATPAPEGEAAPSAAPEPAEVIPPAPPVEGTEAWYAAEIREYGTFNERAEGLVKGTDWVEAYVPLPMALHSRCQAAAKAMGVSLKQFRIYAFSRLVAEVENAEG